MKKTFLVLPLIVLFAACNTNVTTETESNLDTETIVEINVVLSELQELESAWHTALLRGDAELAPSYSEFMIEMREILSSLEEIIEEGDVSEEIVEIKDALQMSLMRGDAELAPTYSEAMASARELLDRYESALELL